MITVTITSPRQLAGIAAAAGGQDPATYLQAVVEAACESYREQFAVDRITSSDFLFRFTSAEMAAITAAAETDPAIAGFIARVKESAYVWLAADEVQAGAAYLVAQGLLTQARADEVVSY